MKTDLDLEKEDLENLLSTSRFKDELGAIKRFELFFSKYV